MSVLTVSGLEIPEGLSSLCRFRRWVATLDEHAPRVHFYRGRVEIDMSSQLYWDHGAVVKRIGEKLALLTDELDLGRYFIPPSWVTDTDADLSTEPDGFLVKWVSFSSGRVRINPSRETEMLGAPDMALEVVSRSTVKKDTVDLVLAYARARVSEYWIVDARWGANDLRVLTLGRNGRYRARARNADGWVTSPCFGRAFRLHRFLDKLGQPDFRLEARPL